MTLFYITRDVERAVGLLGAIDDYYIITNSSPLAEAVRDKHNDRLVVISRQEKLSTLALMRNKEVQDVITQLSKDNPSHIVVFKNSRQIEEECKRLDLRLLNPSVELSRKIENKMSQYAWLREEKSALIEVATPMSTIGELCQCDFGALIDQFGEGFILQYNTGHTGSGTKRIYHEYEWKNEVERFPRRVVKISRYIAGKAYTINACVIGNEVICGRTSEQITGKPELTNNPFATVGNDWSNVSDGIHNKVKKIATEIGYYMKEDGWRGLFGIDVVMPADDDAHPGYLIEINARQPASASLESQIQNEKKEVSTMEWHMKALTAINQNSKFKIQNEGVPAEQYNGIQLFFRNIENRPVQLKNEFMPGRYKVSEKGVEFIEKATSVAETQKGEFFAFSISQADKVKPGGELLRIQSKQGIVDTFGKNYQDVMKNIRRQLYVEI